MTDRILNSKLEKENRQNCSNIATNFLYRLSIRETPLQTTYTSYICLNPFFLENSVNAARKCSQILSLIKLKFQKVLRLYIKMKQFQLGSVCLLNSSYIIKSIL